MLLLTSPHLHSSDVEKYPLHPLWAKLYQLPHFPSYNDVITYRKDHPQSYLYFDVTHSSFMNYAVYKRRMEFSLLPFLYDAERRGEEEGKSVYAIVVGLGLGVWAKKSDAQVNGSV